MSEYEIVFVVNEVCELLLFCVSYELWPVVRLPDLYLLAETDASCIARNHMATNGDTPGVGRHPYLLGNLDIVPRGSRRHVLDQDECAGAGAASLAAQTACDMADNGARIVLYHSGERHRHECATANAATGDMGTSDLGQR